MCCACGGGGCGRRGDMLYVHWWRQGRVGVCAGGRRRCVGGGRDRRPRSKRGDSCGGVVGAAVTGMVVVAEVGSEAEVGDAVKSGRR
jgi:hypothetical protein